MGYSRTRDVEVDDQKDQTKMIEDEMDTDYSGSSRAVVANNTPAIKGRQRKVKTKKEKDAEKEHAQLDTRTHTHTPHTCFPIYISID